MRKLFALLSLLVIASMALAACGGGAAPATEAPVVPAEPQATEAPAEPTAEPYHGTLRINMGSFPDIVDPQKSSFVGEIAVLKLVYEGLTRLDKDLNTIPAAAESWEYNDDATVIRLD